MAPAGFDIVKALENTLKALWWAIETPFKLWLRTPAYFRWGVLFFIGSLGLLMCYFAWKNRNEWRFYYRE